MTDQSQATTEQIWRELSDQLRQFVRSRVHASSDVDDIIQSVFLRIHEQLATLRSADRMESWVYQITRNAITDHFRRQTRRPVEELNETPAPTHVEENENKRLAGCIGALIDHLPDDQRRALSMYELEGVPQATIAAHESISLSGAKSRIQRGRKALETMLHECCIFQFDTHGNVLDYNVQCPECASNCGCQADP